MGSKDQCHQGDTSECSRIASIVACAGGVCLRFGHTLAHDRKRYRPPARSGAHPICIWVLRGARVFWVETARPGVSLMYAWLAGPVWWGLCGRAHTIE